VNTETTSADRLNVGTSAFFDPDYGLTDVMNWFGTGPFPLGVPSWGTVTPGSNPLVFVGNPTQMVIPPTVVPGIGWILTVTVISGCSAGAANIGGPWPMALQVVGATAVDSLFDDPYVGSMIKPLAGANFIGAATGGTLSGQQLIYPATPTSSGFPGSTVRVALQTLILPTNEVDPVEVSFLAFEDFQCFYQMTNAQDVFAADTATVQLAVQLRPTILTV
jgi:hypothetical protein